MQFGRMDCKDNKSAYIEWLLYFSVMYDIICYYVQQIVYWTLYFGVAGFVIYIFIGQQIHDARIMLGKDKKEESKETKNI